MKKLIKTRKLLKELIEKDRPITDISINESIKEIEYLEKNYNRYRNAFLFLAGLGFARLIVTTVMGRNF